MAPTKSDATPTGLWTGKEGDLDPSAGSLRLLFEGSFPGFGPKIHTTLRRI